MTAKAGWLVAGITLLLLAVGIACTAARPDDGLDHGGNPCSAALFEALGLGSNDTSSNAEADDVPSAIKGTIAYCQEAAQERLAIAGVLLALGVAALAARRRVRSESGADVSISW